MKVARRVRTPQGTEGDRTVWVSRLLVLVLIVGGLSILSTGTAHAAITGGEVRVVGEHVVHVFEESGQLVIPADLDSFEVEYLAIAGGGGGGGSNVAYRASGGGGAGGAVEGTFLLEPGESYVITIGAGGGGGEPGEQGHDGGETTIGAVVTVPGGGGGGTGRDSGALRDGRDGGSGGGAAAGASGGSAVSGGTYGHDGGSSSHGSTAAGGGGANDRGTSAPTYGHGGAGWSSTLAASYGLDTVGLAGGGGGGGYSVGNNGSHGGGRGGNYTNLPGGHATSYGSGGGGAGTVNPMVDAPGGNGHAGVVVIRYPIEHLPKVQNTVAPQISGNPVDGATLTVSDGTWDATVIASAYRWERCDAGVNDCHTIGGATSTSYTLGLDDVGSRLRAIVTATPELGVDVDATSDPTAVITARDVVAGTPSVSGVAQHGQTLTADPDADGWDGSGTFTFAYQWYRQGGSDASAIAGADGASYQLRLDDIGHRVWVQVTGTPTVGGPASVPSAWTDEVQPLTTMPGTPTVSGTARDWETLTVDVDEAHWHGSGVVTFETVWLRCNTGDCAPVSTGPARVLTIADIGYTIRAQVTGTPTHGPPATVTTVPTTVVSPADVTPGTPTISGVARHGQTLTVSSGAWAGSGPFTFSYQWERLIGPTWQPIDGADAATYLLGLDDIGHEVRVQVTGTPAAGTPVSVSSDPTGQVQPLPTTPGTPAVSGTPRDGQTLTVDVDAAGWHGSGDITFDIVWLRCDADDCTPIAGIDSQATAYELTTDDIGHTIAVQVTGTPTHGAVAAVTAVTEPVGSRDIVAGAVTISGTAQVTETLTAHPDAAAWDGSSPLTFDVVWWRCLPAGCVQLGHGDTHLLTVDDLDATVRVDVTATDAWGRSRTVSSAATGPVVGVDEPVLAVPSADTAVAGNITVTGVRFLPHSRAQVWLHSDPTLLGEVTVSADGTFTRNFALPPGISGDHTVVVVGHGLDGRPRTVSSPVRIADSSPGVPTGPQQQPAGSSSPAQSIGGLASTGAPAIALGWVGLMAVLLGTLLVRRRQVGTASVSAPRP